MATTATKIVATGTIIREVHLHNEQGNIWIGGDNTVSTSNGVKVDNNTHDVMYLPATTEVWAVTNTGTAIVYVLEVNQ